MSLVTRDPATGLRRSPICFPDGGRPPTPFGCRWCGVEQRGHAQRWKPSAGWHTWTRPTDAQILARMRARRAARLDAPPTQYHVATVQHTEWSYISDTPIVTDYCADCDDSECPRWTRINDRIDEQRRIRRRPSYACAYPDEEPF